MTPGAPGTITLTLRVFQVSSLKADIRTPKCCELTDVVNRCVDTWRFHPGQPGH